MSQTPRIREIETDVVNNTPVGAVIAFAGSAAPAGWLLCDGNPVSRTAYAALFAVIAETHGEGDNSTTFNVPDYRGRFLRGVDGGTGRDPNAGARTPMATGGNPGSAVGSIQDDEFEAHTHNSARQNGAAPQFGGIIVLKDSGVADFPLTTAGGSSETRPKNAYVTYIIKY